MKLPLILSLIALSIASSGDCPVKCRCNLGKHEVFCDKRGFSKFPDGIPSGTLRIDLSGNNLTEITPSDVAHLRDLRKLNLADNHISQIVHGTLESFPRLYSFDFSGNPYPPSQIASDIVCRLHTTNIHKLIMDRLNLVYEQSLFHCFSRLGLLRLSLSGNNLGRLPDNAFSGLTTLQSLILNNAIDRNFNAVALSNLTSLDSLDLSNNLLRSFPNFNVDGKPVLPSIRRLYLNFNQIRHITNDVDVGLLGLHRLIISNNKINALEDNVFMRFSNLLTSDLSHNPINQIKEYAFNHSILNELFLSHIAYTFRSGDKTLFHHCPNLTNLQLIHADMYRVFQPNVGNYIFSKLPKLEVLVLSSARIRYLPIGVFQKLTMLQKLILSDNSLHTLQTGIFKGQTRLEKLYLDYNSFPGFNRSSFPRNLKAIAFGGNPFACTCRLLWIVGWIKLANLSIIGSKQNYQCFSPPEVQGVSIYDFPLTEEDCSSTPLNLALILGLSFACFAAIIIVTVSVSYRYRWHLGYLYFSMKARIRQHREIQDDREYMYDAFLAYNNQDLPWVRQHLLPALEEEGGLQLCLHDRNWLPGVDIMDNIVTSIENSRKTVMVVSNAFASSQWCQLELTMAQHRLFEEDRNNLVLILLEDIDQGNMTPRLALQMRSRTYIKWTADPVGQRLFWKKLNRTLMKPDRRVLQNPYGINT